MDKVVEMGPRQSNLSGSFLHPIPMELTPEEMELPVPADGVIPLYIQLMNDTETLTIDVRRHLLITLKNKFKEQITE